MRIRKKTTPQKSKDITITENLQKDAITEKSKKVPINEKARTISLFFCTIKNSFWGYFIVTWMVGKKFQMGTLVLESLILKKNNLNYTGN